MDCHNVRVTLFDKFSEISTLRKCSFAFLILNFVEQGIDKLQKCCDYGEKANELEDDYLNSQYLSAYKQKLNIDVLYRNTK